MSLEDLLRRMSREGSLVEPGPGGTLRCLACGHRCVVPEGRSGVCKVRFNVAGKLMVPDGYVAGLQIDPIEKKPFYHVRPGSRTLSFGMLGCDYHCRFCQNWLSSQALRDPASSARPQECSAAQLIQLAKEGGAPIVTSTYNEPLITGEWAVEVFRLAKAAGLRTALVSNGNATPEALANLKPWLDFCKVDLKGFDDARYRRVTGGALAPVLETIAALPGLGVWVEVVTLVIPGFNDSDEELRKLTAFLASVSKDIPWHATGFHADYRMTETPDTPAETLLRAAAIGKAEGLRYVYTGNRPGMGRWEDTACHRCGVPLIERAGFTVKANRLKGGACPDCGEKIPGVWN